MRAKAGRRERIVFLINKYVHVVVIISSYYYTLLYGGADRDEREIIIIIIKKNPMSRADSGETVREYKIL